MEVRSSRRLRTLVTQLAGRGLSHNEIARALISMVARSTALQSKAGYIDARPPTTSSSKSSCYARPDHTLGHVQRGRPRFQSEHFRYVPIATEVVRWRNMSKWGQPRHFALRKQHPYSITSSARASNIGGTLRPSAVAVLRLITSSYLVGFCTGRSAAFTPLRMRST